jgi:hypothetical protein
MTDAGSDDSKKEAIDTAWRIHAALVDWTGKVDTKASFTLTIESAVIGAIIVLSGAEHRLYGLQVALYWVGVCALGCAVLAAASVVVPRVRRSAVANEAAVNYIYFDPLKS